MSRIGKAPITLPKGVEVNVNNGIVTVKGAKGTLTQKVDTDITVAVDGGNVVVTRPTDQKRHRALHGLYRSLIANMVKGVSEGYKTEQELVGVGYRASNKGGGYSKVLHQCSCHFNIRSASNFTGKF